MSNSSHKVEVIVGLNTLLSVNVEVPGVQGEPDWDEAKKLALQKVRKLFLDWLQNPENEVSFDISDCNEIKD
jgi:hypothetical protein